MASTLGETVGETVGLRVRLQSLVSARTRIEVVTEGVFARMILDDPALDGVAAVLFDEFHERSLDADLGLALALDAQEGLREDLRILVMSATLDGARVASFMPGATLIESAGRAFPVATRYLGRDPRSHRGQGRARHLARARRRERLDPRLPARPGRNPARRRAVEERLRDPNVDVAPLYGAMDARAQDRAVAPPPKGRRKVVLATSIAETSLTIEGVRVVVDCGLMRVPRYEPDVGLTRLETVRVSRANADQRRGRAGRVEPGVCYRLWEEAGTGGLAPFAQPEILAADLSGLALDLAVWGVADPAGLKFLDPPPRAAFKEARALLASLGALDADGKVTDEGKAIAGLALPPRLARMVVDAARAGEARLAAELAVVLTERGLGGDAVDLTRRLEASAATARRAPRTRGGWRGIWRARATGPHPGPLPERERGSARRRRMARRRVSRPHRHGAGQARRVPDGQRPRRGARAARPARRRGVSGDRRDRRPRRRGARRRRRAADARRDRGGRRRRNRDARGDGVRPRLRLAARAPPPTARRADARRGSLSPPADEASALALARGISPGPARLPWTKPLAQWRGRVDFLRRAEGEPWPDLADAALAASPDWLAPFLARQDAARRVVQRRTRPGVARAAALRSGAPAGGRGAEPLRRADRHRRAGRLRVRRRPERRAAGAGAVRPRRPPGARRRARAADAASVVARASADPDHPRPAGLLEGLVGRRARRPARPLSPPFLAGRPGERGADQPGETARDVRANFRRAARRLKLPLISRRQSCYQRYQMEPERYHMPAVTIRNLSAQTHRALKLRAARHGRSAEAEVRAILDEAVRPKGRLKVGAELAAFGRRFGGVDLETTRDPSPTEPASFE